MTSLERRDPTAADGTPIPLAEIRAARERLAGIAVRTPLLRLDVEDAPAEIWLKLETLQPIGSFKIRGAANSIALAPPELLARGVWTASAGNMGQGVAWEARRRGIPCAVVAPDHAPEAKLSPMRRLGARIVKIPYLDWFEVLKVRAFPGMEGYFVHPVSDRAVMAGNGTIGLEIIEDLPEVDTIVVPIGGGGLSGGIACAAKALKPGVRVLVAEVETAAPFTPSFASGRAERIDYRPSFVDGAGAPAVLEDMWPLLRRVIDGAVIAPLDRIAAAIRLLVECQRVVAEGAGAIALAAALAGGAGRGKVACIVSGGNLDPAKLAAILEGKVP